MPQVTIHFSLPEEQEEFTLCANAAKWQLATQELDEYLRGLVKYGISKEHVKWGALSEEKKQEIEGILADVRSYLHEFLDDNGLELYE